MLNAHKLLYLMPDVALVAELLPAKKAHSFAIQTFRQINGQFLDEENLLAENIAKLFEKLEPGDYHLILPDLLFTNTILTLRETEPKAVDSRLTEELLPSLGMSEKSHQIQTNLLASFNGQSKVQLTAIEHQVLLPIKTAVAQSEVHLLGLSPLSWTAKSLVSLEPSITLLQVGAQVHSALHYIGVDQTNQFPLDDIEAIVETVKSLKGAESNIQTVYLVTNTVVESSLKELLSEIIPLQQLASLDEEAKIPPYLQTSIEAGMRTLSISDFPVPIFQLAAVVDSESLPMPTHKSLNLPHVEPDLADLTPPKISPQAELPVPELAPNQKEEGLSTPDGLSSNESVATAKVEDRELDTQPALTHSEGEKETRPVEQIESLKKEGNVNAEEKAEFESTGGNLEPSHVAQNSSEGEKAPVISQSTSPKPEIDLTQFAVQNQEVSVTRKRPMHKVILISLFAFIATVATGVGIGMLILRLTSNQTPPPPPTQISEAEAQTSPTPTLAPTLPPAPAVDLKALNVLVVNATTTAGLAGTVSTTLTSNGVGKTSAGNAKGTYSEATSDLVLLAEPNPALVEALMEASGRKLVLGEGFKTEVATGSYDAVIVLTQSK